MPAENKKTAILLMHCPDQKGIVASVTDFLNQNRGNIIYLEQYVDPVKSMFFMRVEWDIENFLIPREKIAEYFRTLVGKKLDMTFDLYFNDQKPRIALFVSKMSHCLYDILARYDAGELQAEIPLIISNHPDLKHVADKFGIDFYVFPINKDNKDQQEQKELELLDKDNIDLVVLARYMQVISDDFIRCYKNRIINIHHSFLPAFVGAKPYHAAYERGVKIIGATSHYVTPELDAGPIIEQDVTRVSHTDTVEDMIRKGRNLEKTVLSYAIEKHIAHKVLPYENRTIVF